MRHDRRRILGSLLLLASGLLLVGFGPASGPYDNVLTVLGATLLPVGGAMLRPVYDRWDAHRRAERVRRSQLSSWHQRRLRVGDIEVDMMSAEYLCDGQENLARLIELDFPRTLKASREPPAELGMLRERLLPELVADAEQRYVGFYDDPAVDLLDVVTIGERTNDDDAPIRGFSFAATSYYTFALTANSLDHDLTALLPDLDAATLREHWHEHRLRRLEDVVGLPAPAKVGVGTAVVTSDGLLVLLERGQVFQAPSGRERMLHGVAEGMIPSDVRDDRITPVQTAYRGLREELGVRQDEVRQLHLTGIFLDHARWQPLFTAAAYLAIDADSLVGRSPQAAHGHETRELQTFVFDPADPALRSLLLTQHETFGLASNHAQATVLAALTAQWGIPATEASLRRSRI